MTELQGWIVVALLFCILLAEIPSERSRDYNDMLVRLSTILENIEKSVTLIYSGLEERSARERAQNRL